MVYKAIRWRHGTQDHLIWTPFVVTDSQLLVLWFKPIRAPLKHLVTLLYTCVNGISWPHTHYLRPNINDIHIFLILFVWRSIQIKSFFLFCCLCCLRLCIILVWGKKERGNQVTRRLNQDIVINGTQIFLPWAWTRGSCVGRDLWENPAAWPVFLSMSKHLSN